MTPFTQMMEQDATYWPPGQNDGYGTLSFANITPVAIKCRWQAGNELFRNAQGVEVVSNAIVYTNVEVLEQGWLVLGTAAVGATGTDPREIMGSQEVRRAFGSPSLQADEQLYKVML